MRRFLVLFCTLALACVGYAAHEEHKPEPKKKEAKHTEHAASRQRHPANINKPSTKPLKPVTQSSPRPRNLTPSTKPLKPVTQSSPRPRNLTPSTKPLKPVTPFHAYGLNLPNKPNPRIASVKFQQNRRIQGSQNWQGKNYWAFRNYRSVWHDKFWWSNHYSRVILVSGGWYYWNAGFWYPAWGSDSGNAYYPYDGPIYAYNNLPPNQVIGNVQLALQQQVYYHGEVDGLLRPLTRDAIANYQRDHGLYVTSSIDQPTLQSLGMA